VIGRLAKPNRREFLRASLLGSGALLVGFDRIGEFARDQKDGHDPFRGGKQLGTLEFTGESRTPLDTVIGAGLDARLYSDLSALSPEQLVTPVEKFYTRTCASELLDAGKPWTIKVGGLVQEPVNLALEDLKKSAKPMGLHLMECSGNTRATRFGLLSVGDWTGVPISDLLAARIKPRTDRVMVSGFDQYTMKSATSIPGADWIFTLEELQSAKAFLATEMNEQPLTKDHGAPVRLLVSGWYGCTCIKWVNAITFVDKDSEATSQMQEFAVRTHQQGIPNLAKDYRPAIIDQAAMPIRVEKWRVNGRIKYRVVGILWGGSRPIRVLEIRFNPEEDYVRVDSFSQAANDPWSFWSHAWTPKAPDTYMIRLRVTDPVVPTKRLDSGHYDRSVEVIEVEKRIAEKQSAPGERRASGQGPRP
jgi:DMSO/TMAO reductase YedYZ molybdopterin-dependent catalytic subunit